MADLIFITHPDVVIDPAVPVPEWPLSERGRARMAAAATRPWLAGVRSMFASAERKARDGASILCDALGLADPTIVPELGENDRSATGYLDKPAFEAMADRFFAEPAVSVMGWERAIDAQARIVAAIDQVLRMAPPEGDIAVIGHGGTGTLLLCHLAGWPIDRRHDQPPTAGGNWFSFDRVTRTLGHSGWRSIDGK